MDTWGSTPPMHQISPGTLPGIATRDDEPPGTTTPNSDRPAAVEAQLHRVPPRQPWMSSGTGPAPHASEFPTRLFDRPSSVFVYGSSRPLVNLTLYALATHTNPEFQWVEIGSLSEDRMPCDPVRLGWIPRSRLWVIDRPGALRPYVENLPIHDLIRSDEAPETLAHFAEFVRLPETSQRILTTGASGRPGVVAVSNAQRVEESFPTSMIPSILDVHRSAGYSVLVGYGEKPGAGRELFDFVFRLQGTDREKKDWKGIELVCEKGISIGPLKDRAPVRLEAIPLIANVVSEARPTP